MEPSLLLYVAKGNEWNAPWSQGSAASPFCQAAYGRNATAQPLYIIAIFTLAGLLVACAQQRAPVMPAAAPLPAPEKPVFTQEGQASWYGESHHGKTTANGEAFDMQALTAAHRNLPFGTVVRVTNLASKRSVKVRINDRGPYVDGRIIDLSARAAGELGIAKNGVGRVRIEQFASDQKPGS